MQTLCVTSLEYVHMVLATTNKHTQIDASRSTINISNMNKYEANKSDTTICFLESDPLRSYLSFVEATNNLQRFTVAELLSTTFILSLNNLFYRQDQPSQTYATTHNLGCLLVRLA